MSLTMSGCGHNHYTRLCVCLSSLSIRRSFTGPEVQMLQCHHDNSHVETLDFHSWLDALFSLGFNDDIIPQHAEERSDLYCLWKPLQHNCGPFFSSLFFFSLFQICWHHRENEGKVSSFFCPAKTTHLDKSLGL